MQLLSSYKFKFFLSSAYDYDDESKGIATITEKVPESITTYLIYGVSMSKYDGMGLSDNIPTVSIFLPFFLSVELPFSVKRNEVLVQDILIFNYLPRRQTVDVKITKSDLYQAVDLDKYGWKDSKGYYVKTINTRINQNIKLQFALKSNKIGFVPFEVTAKGPLAGDGIKKQLRIIPEGVARSITSSVFLALDSKNPEEKVTLRCNYPDSAYPDTTSVSATVAGDVFGKAISNLDKLIHMPNGCGEQTMLSLAPDIAIYEYLKSSDKLGGDLEQTLLNYIRAGYQNELRYFRYDGSFSAFGNGDQSGSTWLTAYVIQYFYFAKSIISIDSNVIKRGADFIVSNQNEDGSFREPGRVIHSDMQGASGTGIGLTAYCVIVLSILGSDYATARDKAVKYLEDKYTDRSLYELGVVSNALLLAGSSKASAAYNLLYGQKTEASGLLYWTTPAPEIDTGYWYRYQPRSVDIELTSYGLLAVIKKGGSLATVLKIVKYLVSKGNSLGGYTSSQDTVMAFYALSQFARTYSLDANVELTMTPNTGKKFTATVDSSNAFTLQSFDLLPNTTKLAVTATSDDSGIAIVNLICNFYEDPTKVVPVFNVTYNYEFSCTSRMTLNVCARYIPTGTSNMAIMIVNMPSGYIYNERRQINQDISRIEVINQGSQVIFYFNSFTNTESCAKVYAYRAKLVAELKGATIEVYDYYDTSKQGMTTYPPPDGSNRCYYYEYMRE
ncbi:CD109 antigen-like [Chironomus tepperi]|uniref:CD109 antigen-like n=1 Tax=Chironomus tepperi TaxID=113505 RepID=UPI00391F676A